MIKKYYLDQMSGPELVQHLLLLHDRTADRLRDQGRLDLYWGLLLDIAEDMGDILQERVSRDDAVIIFKYRTRQLVSILRG